MGFLTVFFFFFFPIRFILAILVFISFVTDKYFYTQVKIVYFFRIRADSTLLANTWYCRFPWYSNKLNLRTLKTTASLVRGDNSTHIFTLKKSLNHFYLKDKDVEFHYNNIISFLAKFMNIWRESRKFFRIRNISFMLRTCYIVTLVALVDIESQSLPECLNEMRYCHSFCCHNF